MVYTVKMLKDDIQYLLKYKKITKDSAVLLSIDSRTDNLNACCASKEGDKPACLELEN